MGEALKGWMGKILFYNLFKALPQSEALSAIFILPGPGPVNSNNPESNINLRQ